MVFGLVLAMRSCVQHMSCCVCTRREYLTVHKTLSELAATDTLHLELKHVAAIVSAKVSSGLAGVHGYLRACMSS